MSSHSLHWAEGLFLRPHHFQAQELLLQESLARSTGWLQPFPWGLHSLEVDSDSLANLRVSLSSCHARLQDGTLVRFPEDCHISPEPIPRALFRNSESRVRVSLGVPELRRGPSNVAAPGSAQNATQTPLRFVPHQEDREDENAAGNPQPVDFRRLNPRILFSAPEESLRGYDAVPLFQLRLGSTPEAPPRIDNEYIPPILRLEASAEASRIIRSVYDRLGAMSGDLAAKILDRGVSLSTGHRDDFEIILRLHAVNSALGGLAPLPFLPNVHPLTAFTELARAAGLLAVFRPERRLAQLPPYLHHDIALSFRELRKLLDFAEETEIPYKRREFGWQGLQLAVRIDKEWLETGWNFFIGVESSLSSTRVVEILSERELLMKVGSAEEVDRIYTGGRAGVQVMPVSDIQIPRTFPRNNWHYFRVQRDDRNSAWVQVERTFNLAVRVNERKIQKSPDAAHKFDVKDNESGNLASLGFSLFATRTT